MENLFLFCTIYLFAGFIQGLTGFGAALVAIPLLSFIIDVKTAVPLTLLNGIFITTYLALKLRSHLDYKKIFPLIIGAVPGLIAGVVLFRSINSEFIKLLLGLVLILYSSYCLLVRPKAIDPPVVWAYFAGFLTGLITIILSAGGPPTIIYATLNSWKKEIIKATLTGFFAVNAYLAVAAQAIGGFITAELLLLLVKTAPFVLVGTVIGSRLTSVINRELYLQLIHLLLIGMGGMLVFA